MRALTTIALTLGLVLAAVRGAETEEFKELKVMKGTWGAETKQQEGGLSPKGKAQYVSIELIADGTAKINGAENLADVRINPTKEPRTIDIEYVDGPLKGKKQFGIYEFKKGKTDELDTWTIVIADIDVKAEDRPKDIAKAGGKSARYVFGRSGSNSRTIE